MELLLSITTLKSLLPLFAIIAGLFVISTKNAIISVFNLIVLYILVAFYLIYIGVTFLGISYIIIYIGAIAILFLFIIMMIDIEVVEKRNNNYLPLLFLLLSGFLLTLKNILYNIGLIKIKNIMFEEEKVFSDQVNEELFNYNNFNYSNDRFGNINKIEGLMSEKEYHNNFALNKVNYYINYFEDYLSKIEDIDYISTLLPNWKEWFVISFINKITNDKLLTVNDFFSKKDINLNDAWLSNNNYSLNSGNNYLLIIPNWDFAMNRITQITGIGDILYTVYHSYIYILSIILLLSMVGAIILTASSDQEVKVVNILRNKKSSIIPFYFNIKIIRVYLFSFINKVNDVFFITYIKELILYMYNIYIVSIVWCYKFFFLKYIYVKIKKCKNKYKGINIHKNKLDSFIHYNKVNKKNIFIPSFFREFSDDYLHTEDILGNLIYFIIANFIIALLLLSINYYFSLSVKYLDKGGGFECGFTNFVQTRERFNVIFYRISLLFLIFDLEIILAFPYTAIYQKDQNISKNNVLVFLYILIVGFIYELKEGALNIVKKAHPK